MVHKSRASIGATQRPRYIIYSYGYVCEQKTYSPDDVTSQKLIGAHTRHKHERQMEGMILARAISTSTANSARDIIWLREYQYKVPSKFTRIILRHGDIRLKFHRSLFCTTTRTHRGSATYQPLDEFSIITGIIKSQGRCERDRQRHFLPAVRRHKQQGSQQRWR